MLDPGGIDTWASYRILPFADGNIGVSPRVNARPSCHHHPRETESAAAPTPRTAGETVRGSGSSRQLGSTTGRVRQNVTVCATAVDVNVVRSVPPA